MMRILGIHGIGNLRQLPPQQAAELLSQRWRAALSPGLALNAVVDLRVAYYAHCLTREEPQAADSLEHLNPAAGQLVMAWVAALGAPPEVAQGRLMAPVRQAADWIAGKYGLDRRSVRVYLPGSPPRWTGT